MELTGDELCTKCDKIIAGEKGFITGIEEATGKQVYICLSCAVDLGVTADNKDFNNLPIIHATVPSGEKLIN